MADTSCKVVIFAGGFGTRLKEETEFRPKPMIKIGGKPIIWHIMKIYSHYGYNDFIVAGGYKVEQIKEYFLNFVALNNDFTIDLASNKLELLSKNKEKMKVAIIDTGLKTMTGGRLKRLRKYIGNNTFMATYGDGVADVNINELIKFHRRHKKYATVTGVHPSSRWGELNIKENLVVDFKEKPQVKDSYINGGFFVFEPQIFNYIEADHICLEREPLQRLSEEGHLAIFKHDGFWKCMDTYKDMNELSKLWERGEAKWKIWE
ncbi:glucose-1-phosphate cytidylyltransferase [Candidatus Woesearchaeota archaeon]|nr:glucose-1-phosphate cytidylyltransferase [Candidatus Woesearchaeota archaeon]